MNNQTLSQTEQKALVGRVAIDRLVERGLIHSNMKIGLGTGSTAMPAVRRLADYINDGTLCNIKAVATSFQTSIECEKLGIPVFSLNSKVIDGKLDFAIDGADEIDAQKNLIKGGGAALLLEKIIAYNSNQFVIVADESKDVENLGTGFRLPVEVIPEARVSVVRALENLGADCVLREGLRKAGPVITDNGNIIVDILWKNAVDAKEFEKSINCITGVVENGFFTQNTPLVFIARANGTVQER